MRKLLLSLLAVAACAVPAGTALGQDEFAAVPRITIADLQKLQATGAVTVVDVRDVESYRAGHIKGAISIPLEQVSASVQRLKGAKKPIVTYCA